MLFCDRLSPPFFQPNPRSIRRSLCNLLIEESGDGAAILSSSVKGAQNAQNRDMTGRRSNLVKQRVPERSY